MPANQSNIQPYYRSLIFRENFRDVKAVSDNGGQITGTPTIENGLVSTGSSDEIGYGTLTELYNRNAFTLHLRGYKPVASEVCYIAGVWSSNQNQFLAYYTGTDLRFYVSNTLSSTDYVNIELTAGQTYDITCVFDGTLTGNTNRAKIYVDKVLQATASHVTIPAVMTSPDNIFRILDGGGPVGTELSGVEVFNKALSQEEVNDLVDNSTYSEVNPETFPLFIKPRSSFLNGTDVTIKNYGTGADVVFKGGGNVIWSGKMGITTDGLNDYFLTDTSPTEKGTLFGYITPISAAFTTEIIIGCYNNIGTTNARAYLSLENIDLAYLSGGIGDQNPNTIQDAESKGLIGVATFAALSWDGAVVNLYQGNRLAYTGAQVGSMNSSLKFTIGALNANGVTSTNYSNVTIHSLGYADFALTHQQIRYLEWYLKTLLNA